MKEFSHPLHVPTNPFLERLHLLEGNWQVEISAMSFSHDPAARAIGRASFKWTEDGAFLRMQTSIPDSGFPLSTAMIAPDDVAEKYSVLYFDARGVSRIYNMSLDDHEWRLWRNFPGRFQRFTAHFDRTHNTISAEWEKSINGTDWEHDFSLTYTRVK